MEDYFIPIYKVVRETKTDTVGMALTNELIRSTEIISIATDELVIDYARYHKIVIKNSHWWLPTKYISQDDFERLTTDTFGYKKPTGIKVDSGIIF